MKKLLCAIVLALSAGCATLNDRPPLPASATPDAARAYVYGRFKLNPGSVSSPRLLLHLHNLDTSKFVRIPLEQPTEELYLIDVVPGQYQFTSLLRVPVGAMDQDVQWYPIRVPAEMRFLLKPFRVEAGKAYYIGDWTGAQSRDIEYYFVVTRYKFQWGIYWVAFDQIGATAELRRLYPGFGSIDARSAWAD